MVNRIWIFFSNRVNFSPTSQWDGTNQRVNTVIANTDQFLIERPLQPKKAMQEYASQNWIITPKQFSSLQDALEIWKEFIIRSEHPQEYAVVSWLAESYRIKPEDIEKYKAWKTPEELFEIPITEYEIIDNELSKNSEFLAKDKEDSFDYKRINHRKKEALIIALMARVWYISDQKIFRFLKLLSWRKFIQYAEKLDTDVNDVLSEQSFSISEYIKGINHTVLVDKDISWKYYIVSNWYFDVWEESQTYMDMIIIQDWEIIENWGSFFARKKWTLDHNSRQIKDRRVFDHMKLIEEYEKIRNLDKFDCNHAPIMEFQTWFDEQQYFLQYHKWAESRKKERFILDRELKEWEFESPFFRWVTWPEWLTMDVWTYYFSDETKSWWALTLEDEEASFDFHYDDIFTQLMIRKRKAQFDSFTNFQWQSMLLCSGHTRIAEVFKPDIYVWIPKEVMNEINFTKMFEITNAMEKWFKLKMHVVSDWKRCIVKIITTQEEIDTIHDWIDTSIEARKKQRDTRKLLKNDIPKSLRIAIMN